MLWFYFAIIAALANSVNSIVSRKVLKQERIGVYVFSVLFNAVGTLLFLPLLLMDGISFPVLPEAWIFAVFSIIVWSTVNITSSIAAKHTEVSIKDPIAASGILVIFLISVILLSESFTAAKLAGIVLVFAGSLAITWKRGKAFSGFSDYGVRMTILTTFLAAFATMSDKVALNYFSISFYGFLQFFASTLILLPFMLRKGEGLTALKGDKRWIFLSAALVMGSYFFSLSAYSVADASLVYPIIRMSTLMSVILGIVLLKEKGSTIRRLFGAAAMVSGAILLV